MAPTMPEYHRGKARSMYRKRYLGVNLSTSTAGVRVQVAVPTPASGLVETKSWRGHLIVRGSGVELSGGGGTPDLANGWAGWYRGQLGTSALQAIPASNLLAQSEIIGVVPWTFGYNDLIIPMQLVGVTLAVQEYLVFVVATHFAVGSPNLRFDGSFLYAEKEVPA